MWLGAQALVDPIDPVDRAPRLRIEAEGSLGERVHLTGTDRQRADHLEQQRDTGLRAGVPGLVLIDVVEEDALSFCVCLLYTSRCV